MPMISTDIEYRLSGGASNAVQVASLGGAKSSTAANAIMDTGTATSGSTITLNDTSKTWTVDEHAGRSVTITGGTGSGQTASIASNTEQGLVFSSALGVALDSSSAYRINDPIFDKVGSAESGAGDIEYRCIYVHNAHATLTMLNAVAWVPSNTPSASTVVEIGLGTSAMNGTEQTVADESAAPSGVTFSVSATKGAGVSLGSIPPGEGRSAWLRRTVTAGASAAADTFTIRVECETEA